MSRYEGLNSVVGSHIGQSSQRTWTRVWWRLARHVTAAILVPMCCLSAGASTVVIKPNGHDAKKCDVFIKGVGTRRLTRFITLGDIAAHYGPAEYHNGSIYVEWRPKGDSHIKIAGHVKPNPNWREELWRYTRGHKATKLWSSAGLEFHVRDDEAIIAILSPFKPNSDPDLYLLRNNGKQVKLYRRKQLAKWGFEFEKWAGRDLWLRDQTESEIYAFIKIDTRSMRVTDYDLSKLSEYGLGDSDYDFNANSLRLAYSDYPMMYDTVSEHDFVKHKTPVRLYVYDLRSKRKRLVARTIAKPFDPKWRGSTILEYNRPRGKVRIRTRVL